MEPLARQAEQPDRWTVMRVHTDAGRRSERVSATVPVRRQLPAAPTAQFDRELERSCTDARREHHGYAVSLEALVATQPVRPSGRHLEQCETPVAVSRSSCAHVEHRTSLQRERPGLRRDADTHASTVSVPVKSHRSDSWTDGCRSWRGRRDRCMSKQREAAPGGEQREHSFTERLRLLRVRVGRQDELTESAGLVLRWASTRLAATSSGGDEAPPKCSPRRDRPVPARVTPGRRPSSLARSCR